jgi:hypothetical protein
MHMDVSRFHARILWGTFDRLYIYWLYLSVEESSSREPSRGRYICNAYHTWYYLPNIHALRSLFHWYSSIEYIIYRTKSSFLECFIIDQIVLNLIGKTISRKVAHRSATKLQLTSSGSCQVHSQGWSFVHLHVWTQAISCIHLKGATVNNVHLQFSTVRSRLQLFTFPISAFSSFQQELTQNQVLCVFELMVTNPKVYFLYTRSSPVSFLYAARSFRFESDPGFELALLCFPFKHSSYWRIKARNNISHFNISGTNLCNIKWKNVQETTTSVCGLWVQSGLYIKSLRGKQRSLRQFTNGQYRVPWRQLQRASSKERKKAFRHTFWFALVIHENRNIIVRGIEFCFSPKVNYAFFSWIFSRLSYISAISWLCYICRPAFAEDRIERLAHVNYYLSSDFILPTVDIFILYLFTFNIAYFKSNMILSIV